MFERFTDGARRIVVLSQEQCRLLGHDHIGTEHLLLALLHDDTATVDILGEFGVTLPVARDRIERSLGRGGEESSGHLPFTARMKQVLALSVDHARRLGQDHVAQPHLLLGLLDVRDSVAVVSLVDFGVDLDALAARVDDLASAAGPDGGPGLMTQRPTASAPRLGRMLARAVGQRDALAAAIRRYGRHEEDCDRTRGCTCGLQDVLDGLDPPDAGVTSGRDQ